MAEEIKLPEIAENIREATVVTILVSEGDMVSKEQSLLEIETDKALSELPSPVSGKVTGIRVSEGDEVKVGSLLMLIDTEDAGNGKEQSRDSGTDEGESDGGKKEESDEPAPGGKEEDGSERDDSGKEKEAAVENKEKTGKVEEKSDIDEEEGSGKEADENEAQEKEKQKSEKKFTESPDMKEDRGKTSSEKDAAEGREGTGQKKDQRDKKDIVPASPSVRRFAREIGVDIHEVEGTGPGNRILADDVKDYAREKLSGEERPLTAGMGLQLPDFNKWGDTERKPMSRIRQITAENTLKSWNTSPHVTQFDKADITNLSDFREKYAETVKKAGGKLTITAILLKITGFALEKFPRFNASLDMDSREIIYKKYFHVGVAVETDRGLLVPVIKDVRKKSLTELAVELVNLAEKARNKKISPEELEGGNFVISNLGGIGGTNFTPVIFPPQVAIMGVARAEVQPVYQNEKFVPRTMLPLNLSYDHKIVDGADGARFLRWICEALENPMAVFLDEAD